MLLLSAGMEREQACVAHPVPVSGIAPSRLVVNSTVSAHRRPPQPPLLPPHRRVCERWPVERGMFAMRAGGVIEQEC
jgi:hypothetical protein